uniref:Uncharacterized protein n=1 Tax=Setaria italica TaxID=4555 RepID=K3YK81_SETIT
MARFNVCLARRLLLRGVCSRRRCTGAGAGAGPVARGERCVRRTLSKKAAAGAVAAVALSLSVDGATGGCDTGLKLPSSSGRQFGQRQHGEEAAGSRVAAPWSPPHSLDELSSWCCCCRRSRSQLMAL